MCKFSIFLHLFLLNYSSFMNNIKITNPELYCTVFWATAFYILLFKLQFHSNGNWNTRYSYFCHLIFYVCLFPPSGGHQGGPGAVVPLPPLLDVQQVHGLRGPVHGPGHPDAGRRHPCRSDLCRTQPMPMWDFLFLFRTLFNTLNNLGIFWVD